MNPFEMVIGIVLIITIGSVLKARYQTKHGIIEDEDGNQQVIGNSDSSQLQAEVKMLKERIQILERIATDSNSANDIGRQIEQLRDR